MAAAYFLKMYPLHRGRRVVSKIKVLEFKMPSGKFWLPFSVHL